jgi:hypothetical protein
MLVHGYDCATGLGLPFEPPDELVGAVIGRLCPWLSGGAEPAWRELLWHTGRIELLGRPAHDDDEWRLVTGPLDEWDGTIPVRDPRPVVEWILSDGTWRPVYLEPRGG